MNPIDGEFDKYKDFVESEFNKDKLIKQIHYSNENKEDWEDNIKKRFVSKIMYNIENGENPELDEFVTYLDLEKTSNHVKVALGFRIEEIDLIDGSFKRSKKLKSD